MSSSPASVPTKVARPRTRKTPRPNARVYGWRRDLPDHRDHRFGAMQPSARPTLPRACLGIPSRSGLAAYDQGPLGACTGNALAFALYYAILQQSGQAEPVSRLFIYYFERLLEGTVAQDAGASVRDGIKSVAQFGAPPETLWPYTRKFTVRPSTAARKAALQHRALHYARIADGDLDGLKTAISTDLPVVFGFTVFESFEDDWTANTGCMRPPQGRPLGGHCVVAVGYDDSIANGDGTFGAVLVRNSWGTKWGIHPDSPVPAGGAPVPPAFAGHFWMPYALFRQGAADCWVIDRVEG